MGRKRASVRREEILGATVDEIERVGSNLLRVADVARRLEVSPSLIIYHFVTKDALVTAAFAHAAENDLFKVRRIAARKQSAVTRLHEVIAWYLPTANSRTWRIWIDGWAAGMYNKQLEETVTRLDREWKSVIADLITEGVEAGEMSVSDPEASAGRIGAFIDGLVIQNVVRADGPALDNLRAWTDDFLAYEIGAGSSST